MPAQKGPSENGEQNILDMEAIEEAAQDYVRIGEEEEREYEDDLFDWFLR